MTNKQGDSQKKVIVMGLGVSGLASLRLLQKQNIESVVISRGEPETWRELSQALAFISRERCYREEIINDRDVQDFKSQNYKTVLLSPGIPREHPLVQLLIEAEMEVLSEIEWAYRTLKNEGALSPIIAITGSNGKTTTTTMIDFFMRKMGISIFTGGNIGIPFSDYVTDYLSSRKKCDFFVLELSSFQLESTYYFRPDYALLLNLTFTHGERYHQISDYARAKVRMLASADAKTICYYDPSIAEYHHFLKDGEFTKRFIDLKAIYQDTDLVSFFKFKLEHFKLMGKHNLANLKFVDELFKDLNLDFHKLNTWLAEFKGVPYRVEKIENKKGLAIYNDSKSTNWDSTMTAVNAFKDHPGKLWLVIGGKKRGHGDSILPHLDFFKARCDKLLFFGEASVDLMRECEGKIDHLASAFSLKDLLKPNLCDFSTSDVLLFSPAYPSFDQYKNYEERGEDFNRIVQSFDSE